MPLLTNAVTRRRALRTLGAGAVASLAAQPQSAGTRWALLSDTHVAEDAGNEFRGFRPAENLKTVLAQVTAWKPDGLLIDGDLAREEGLAGDYSRLKTMLEPAAGVPCGYTLGNHDDRGHFFGAFGRAASGRPQPVKDKHVVVIEHGGLRVVLLDSLYANRQVAGLLGKAQRMWLDEYLQSAGPEPVLLFVHHTLDDGDMSMLDADRFLRIATKHRVVKAVFYGHSHHYGYDTMDGVHLVNLPAVGYNFADSEPVGWVQTALSRDGADLTLRAIGGNKSDDGKSRSLAWRS